MSQSYSFKSITAFLLALYGAMSLFVAIHSATMSHHHTPYTACPFSVQEQSLCTKNLFGYLELLDWVSIQTALLIVGSSVAALFFISFFIRTVVDYRFVPQPLYQQLFSQGILNPKAP